MHGRVKVKTTAEKEREKRIEKEEKCRLFKIGLDKAFGMRVKGENEDALSLTAPLLIGNPDVYTLWNYRREVFEQRKILPDKSVENTDDDQSNTLENFESQFDELCLKELELTSTCLLKNPKSYCVWHHRAWVLKTMKNPNWKREINLCDQFLEMDERNFHCWDYRRFVCSFANISIEEELKFTLKKVEENFSNFSSWHYRSSLFTEAHINQLIDFTQYWSKEYSMVENAIFTDPNDQSPWFYHKWLLATNYGKNMSLLIGNENIKIQVERCYFEVKSGILAICLSKSMNSCPFKIVVKCDNENITFDNKVWCPSSKPFSKVWYCFTSINKPCETIELLSIGIVQQLDSRTVFRQKNKDENIAVLEKLCGSEHQLSEDQIKSLRCLREMEPMNKWVNMTVTMIEKENPQTIATLDPLRRNYYSDQKSKRLIRSFLETMDISTNECVIRNSELSCFYSGEHFMSLKLLDLSGNKLRTINSAFNSLIFLETFILNDNQICDICSSFELLSLTVISLQNNNLNTNCLESLKKCLNLRQVYVFGNDCQRISDSLFELIFEEKSIEFIVKENCISDIIPFVK